MAVTNLGRQFKAQIEQQIRELSDRLAGGGAQDYAEYRYRVGEIAGMNATILILEQLEVE